MISGARDVENAWMQILRIECRMLPDSVHIRNLGRIPSQELCVGRGREREIAKLVRQHALPRIMPQMQRREEGRKERCKRQLPSLLLSPSIR